MLTACTAACVEPPRCAVDCNVLREVYEHSRTVWGNPNINHFPCTNPMQPPNEGKMPDVQQERQRRIRALFDEYIEMYATRDHRLTTRFSQSFTGFTGSWGRLIQDHEEWARITLQDFEQVPGPIRLEVIEVSLQDLCDDVVSVAATLHIHLPHGADLLAREVARLMLVFRLEGAAWMITHCSYSVPYQQASDEEVFPLVSLQEQNRALQALVTERTQALNESQAFFRMLTEDTEDVHWRMGPDGVIT